MDATTTFVNIFSYITSWLADQATAVHFAIIGAYLLAAATLSHFVRKNTKAPSELMAWRSLYWVGQFIASMIVLIGSQIMGSASNTSWLSTNARTTLFIAWRATSIAQVFFDMAMNGDANAGSIARRIAHMAATSFAAHHEIQLGALTNMLDNVVQVLSSVDGIIGKRSPSAGAVVHRAILPIANIVTLTDTAQASRQILALLRLWRATNWQQTLPLILHAATLLGLALYRSYIEPVATSIAKQSRIKASLEALDGEEEEPAMELPEPHPSTENSPHAHVAEPSAQPSVLMLANPHIAPLTVLDPRGILTPTTGGPSLEILPTPAVFQPATTSSSLTATTPTKYTLPLGHAAAGTGPVQFPTPVLVETSTAVPTTTATFGTLDGAVEFDAGPSKTALYTAAAAATTASSTASPQQQQPLQDIPGRQRRKRPATEDANDIAPSMW